MTTLAAKIFIIMTLIFEAITILTGSVLYPVFTVASIVIAVVLIAMAITNKVHKQVKTKANNTANTTNDRMYLLG